MLKITLFINNQVSIYQQIGEIIIESEYVILNRKQMRKLGVKKRTSGGSTNETVKGKQIGEGSMQKLGCSKILKNLLSSNKFINKNVQSTKSWITTPKQVMNKQNNMYQTIFNSKIRSPISTPTNQFNLIRSRADYKFFYEVGSGGFGRVWKVQNKKQKRIQAMKEISKAKVILKKSVNSVINQKEILQSLSSPFIINMVHSFQDRDYLYLTMEYLKGGDLRYHMCFYESFTQQQTKFMVGCLILALQYIHAKGIIHRDIKPQNLVFQQNGYLRITDFGVARRNKENNSEETSGTPGYMAPQVICRMNHSFQADFFALGVIIYEIILKKRPYIGDSRKQIRDKILAHQAKITQKELPSDWSPYCVDFVNKLMKRNRQTRLGYGSINELKSHPWLTSINWINLERKQVISPFVPGSISQSVDYQRQMQNSQFSENDEQTMMLLRTTQIQKLFKSYDSSKKDKHRK